jgi:hypothetical protein
MEKKRAQLVAGSNRLLPYVRGCRWRHGRQAAAAMEPKGKHDPREFSLIFLDDRDGMWEFFYF